jgi:stage III sporulation protein AF
VFAFLKDWVFTLAIYAVIATLMIALLPKGGLSDVVKIVISMVLLLAILSPFIQLLKNLRNVDVVPSDNYFAVESNTRLDDMLANQTVEQAERLLSAEIRQWLSQEKGIDTDSVQAYFFLEDNSIKLSKVSIHLDKDNAANLPMLSEEIRRRYGVTPEIRAKDT